MEEKVTRVYGRHEFHYLQRKFWMPKWQIRHLLEFALKFNADFFARTSLDEANENC